MVFVIFCSRKSSEGWPFEAYVVGAAGYLCFHRGGRGGGLVSLSDAPFQTYVVGAAGYLCFHRGGGGAMRRDMWSGRGNSVRDRRDMYSRPYDDRRRDRYSPGRYDNPNPPKRMRRDW